MTDSKTKPDFRLIKGPAQPDFLEAELLDRPIIGLGEFSSSLTENLASDATYLNLEHNPSSAIDIGVLRQFVGDDEKLILDFVRRIYIDLNTGIFDTQCAMRSGRWIDAKLYAHNMKASSYLIGAFNLASIFEDLYQALLIKNTAQSEELFTQIELIFPEAKKAMSAFIQNAFLTECKALDP